MAPTSARSAGNGEPGVETAREALEKWVETERVISREKRDLALAREMLNERIELVKREIDTMRAKIREAEGSIAEADKKRAEMKDESEKLKGASASLDGALVSLEDRTQALLARLPDPLRERVKPLSQQIPGKPEESRLSLGQRFQNIVGILNEINKFNQEITVASEVRALPGGSAAEVTALYLGIGQACYSGAGGSIAGVGAASEEGWSWKPANDSAKPIATAISILKNEHVASFVQLPIEVQ